jgi:hypothetical protein
MKRNPKPKRGLAIFCLGLAAAVLAYSALYFLTTASSHAAMRAGQPELLWLKQEFNLNETEFQRVAALHASYLPECREICGKIAKQNSEIRAILTGTNRVTPEIEQKLAEIAQLRAQCHKNMLEHAYAISRAMPPAQGRRYLDWIQGQTLCCGGCGSNSVCCPMP